jgi:F-type H+-transporting ATPase subunit gamma
LKGVESKIDESLSYEPSPKAVYDVLIPKYVKGIVYGALVQAFTSEQSARMTAMDSATANAEEMLQSLNLYYNRARQAAITQEITEIVGGAAALE